MRTAFAIKPQRGVSGLSPARIRFNSAMGQIAGVDEQSRARIRWSALSDDERLCRLVGLANGTGDDALLAAHSKNEQRDQHLANLVYCLSKTGSFVSGWLSIKGFRNGLMVEATFAERMRQEELLRSGKLLFNCASAVADNRRKFRVLVEEVGEVAHAIDQIECAAKHERYDAEKHLIVELVQVLAVCAAWLESLKGETP